MYTQHGGGGRSTRSDGSNGPAGASTVTHTACGTVGFLTTGLLTLLFYPVLLSLVRPLHLLSSTAILLSLLLVRLSIWLVLEFVLELRPGALGLR